MNFFLTLICAALFIISCGPNKADQPMEDNKTNSAIIYAWKATLNDITGEIEIKKTEATNLDSLSLDSVIDFINARDSSVHLYLIKKTNDTVYLKIPAAAPLTQQMGSTGSTVYMAELVYNLTEIPGIRYINLNFKAGDHALPGTFSRDSFKDQ